MIASGNRWRAGPRTRPALPGHRVLEETHCEYSLDDARFEEATKATLASLLDMPEAESRDAAVFCLNSALQGDATSLELEWSREGNARAKSIHALSSP